MSNGFVSPFKAGPTPSQSLLAEEEPMGPASAGAGLLDVAAASVMPDVESKIGYYSRSMGIPRERFGVRQGQIVYRRDDGVIQPVEAGTARQVMSGVGATIPAITGTVGALVGSPLGPYGMALGGTLGAMGGQSLREGIAGTPLRSQLTGPAARRVLTEGAIDFGANVFGALVGKGINRALATEAAKTMSREIARQGSNVSKALESTLKQINQKYGTNIILTPAEITGAAGLRGTQMALASDPKTSETMAQFYGERAGEVGRAVKGFMEEISPAVDRDVAGQQLVDVAGEAIAVTRAERSAAARPMYQSAFNVQTLDDAGEVISSTPRMVNIGDFDKSLNALVADYPFLKTQLTKIKNVYKNRTNLPLEFVQNNIKEALDDVISSTKVKKPKAAQKAIELQKQLLSSLDQQVPQYAQARALWGDLSSEITAIEGGSLPRIANKNPRDFYDAGRLFLTKDSPASIRRAKEQILKVEGGQEKWDAAIRGGLESIWEQATRQYKSGLGRPEMLEGQAALNFWATLKGNKAQLSRMQAALSPDQFKALNNLLNVFEATGRAYNFNSTTQAQQLGSEALKQAGQVGSVLKFVTAPYRVLGASSDAIEQGIINANLDALAKVITSPNAVDELLKIKAGKGGGYFNPRNTMVVSRVLAGAGRYGAEVMGDYPEMAIPADAPTAQSVPTQTIAPQTGQFISPFATR